MGGTKKKIGKQRRDKAYWSAKEIGYRSRASFKLVQLNRKFEFLQKSRVCVDLCAAPGSWMQVAREHMPMSSLVVGVDLVPIKPIQGCIALQGDITTDKCKADLKRELQTLKADLVLNDGAPNVGRSWLHDAYQQSLLVLSALRLATDFLVKGGTFVTKVFRSRDYQSLMWVLGQFFRRVHSTKPAASRNESAEIFVVCLGYKAPDKIDPRFLDAKHVFSEVDDAQDDDEADAAADRELINPEKKKRKAPAQGYETGATVLYKKAKASEFIMEDKPIHILNNYNEIHLDEPRIYKHAKTTKEIVECCKDIKVLGMKELRLLKKWREALRAEFVGDGKAKKGQNGQPEAPNEDAAEEDDSDKELQELDAKIAELKDEERREAKRVKKKAAKEKRKIAEKIDLKMVIPGDVGPIWQEDGLFSMKDMKSAEDLDMVRGEDETDNADVLAESEEDDDEESKKPKAKMVKYDKEKGRLDKRSLYYKGDEEASEEEEESGAEDDETGFLGDMRESGKKSNGHYNDESDDESGNPLLVDLENGGKEARRKRKADLWFDREAFKDMQEEDEELAEKDVEEAIKEYKKKNVPILAKDSKDESDSSDSDEDEEQNDAFDVEESYKDLKPEKANKAKEGDDFEVVPQGAQAGKAKKKKKPIVLTPEEQALGQEMIVSKKRKRDILDSGWNRFMFGERDEDLPDWFVKEERVHMRPHVEALTDPKTVAEYRQRQKELNVKTIKKVAEAKARKKRRLAKRMEKAKKKAAATLDNPDLGSREKQREIERAYKRARTGAGVAGAKREVKYVVAKKATATKRARRPAGVKGAYRQVDPRMKKDNTSKRAIANSKRVQKRRLKGKKTQMGK